MLVGMYRKWADRQQRRRRWRWLQQWCGNGNPGNWNTSFLNGFTQFDTATDNVSRSPSACIKTALVCSAKKIGLYVYFNNGSDSDSSFKYTRVCAHEQNKKINDNNMARIQWGKKSHWIKERIKMLSVGTWYTDVINK